MLRDVIQFLRQCKLYRREMNVHWDRKTGMIDTHPIAVAAWVGLVQSMNHSADLMRHKRSYERGHRVEG